MWRKIILYTSIEMFFIGCSSTQPVTSNYLNDIKTIVKKEKEKIAKEKTNIKSYQFTVTPIVGSEQDDARVVVDMGKILKVWIAPYVVKGTLIAAHDIYTWVEAPRFIAGESLPAPHQKTGLITPDNNYPIVYRPDEIYNQKATFSNEELKKYVNKKYEVDNNPAKALKDIDKKDNKYDSLIKKYLEEKKNAK